MNDHVRSRPGGRLARRARSFKDDIIDKLSQIRSSSATRSASPFHHKDQYHRHKCKHNHKGLKHLKGDHCPCSKCCHQSMASVPYDALKLSLSSSGKQSKADKDINCASAFVKQLTFALRYFQDVVEKGKLEQLSGSASVLLEIVLCGYAQLKAFLIDNEQSSLIISATNQVYQSLANLIRWSDTVILRGDNSLDKECVGVIVKSVHDSVNTLVDICIDRYRNNKETDVRKSSSDAIDNSSLTNNSNDNNEVVNGNAVLKRITLQQNKPAPIIIPGIINSSASGSSAHNGGVNHRNSLPEIPLSPREKAILESTNFVTPPPIPFRNPGSGHYCHGHFTERLNHSLSTDSVNGTQETDDNSGSGRPLSITECVSTFGTQIPPPLPPKKKSLMKGNRVMVSQTFDWSSNCHHGSSNCPSAANSIDSCLNLSCRLSADDLLSVSRSEAKFDFDERRARFEATGSVSEMSSPSPLALSKYNVQTAFSNSSLRNFEFSFSSHTTTQTFTSFNQSNISETGSPHRFSPGPLTPMTAPPIVNQNNRIDSLIDQMKSFNTSSSNSHDAVDGPPPQLPVKMRPKNPIYKNNTQFMNENSANAHHIRPPSQYDNILTNDCEQNHGTCVLPSENDANSWFKNSVNHHPQLACSHSTSCPHFSNKISQFTGGCSSFSNINISSCNSINSNMMPSVDTVDGKPPPLPPKKRNMMAYMQAAGSYSGPVDGQFYRHSVHAYKSVQSERQQLEMTFMQHRSFYRSATSSDDSVFSFESSESGFTPPPPMLPPKKSKLKALPQPQQLSPNLEERNDHLHQDHDHPRTSTPLSLVPSSESGISSQSETTIHTENENDAERAPEADQQLDDIPKLGPLDEIDVSRYIIFKESGDDGHDIRGGPIDALVVKAIEVSKNDFMFQEAFLTTYRTLLSPTDLINKLLYRYNKFIHVPDIRQRAARNAFALLVRVVDDMCVGDCSDKLMQQIMDFIYQLVNRGDLALAKVLRSKVIEKMDQKRESAANAGSVLLPSISISIKQSTLLDFKSEHLAEQMTLLDSKLFLKIEIPEVLIWAKEQREELIPNLNTFTEHFNKMSYWARSRILEQEEAKDRERLVLKFLKIMKYLRKMNNFNSYLAILSALDSAPVRRLEWQRNITEGLKDLSALIDSSSSFRAYRQALADTEPPCIPYIGLILQDLTFVHIGNNDYLPDGNVNFAKRWQQYNILDQMRRFKNCHYPFKRNEQIIAFFNNFDSYLSEEAMWQISESIKPRGAHRKS